MKSITPKFVSYRKRVLLGLPGIILFSLFLTLLIFVTDLSRYYLAAYICLGGIILFNFFKLMQRSKKYIKSIEFSEILIRITILDENNKEMVISSNVKDVRIKLVELFFGFNRIGRNFKLQIDLRENGRFKKVFEQYEIGGWNLALFKESYRLYSDAKVNQ